MQNTDVLPEGYVPHPYDDGPRKEGESWLEWVLRVEAARVAYGYWSKNRFEEEHPPPKYDSSRDQREQERERAVWRMQREAAEEEHRRLIDPADVMYDPAYATQWRQQKEQRKTYNENARKENVFRRRELDFAAGLEDKVADPDPPEDSGDEYYERPIGVTRREIKEQLGRDQQLLQQGLQSQGNQAQNSQQQRSQGQAQQQSGQDPGSSSNNAEQPPPPGGSDDSGQGDRDKWWPNMPWPIPSGKRPRCTVCLKWKKGCDVMDTGVPCTLCSKNNHQCLFNDFGIAYKVPNRTKNSKSILAGPTPPAPASAQNPNQLPLPRGFPKNGQLPIPAPGDPRSGFIQPENEPVQPRPPGSSMQRPFFPLPSVIGFDAYQPPPPPPLPAQTQTQTETQLPAQLRRLGLPSVLETRNTITPATRNVRPPGPRGGYSTKPPYLRCQPCKEKKRNDCDFATKRPCTYCEKFKFDLRCVQQRGPGRPPKDGGAAGDGGRAPKSRGINKKRNKSTDPRNSSTTPAPAGRRDDMTARSRSSPRREIVRCGNCIRLNRDCNGGRPCRHCANDFLAYGDCKDPVDQPFQEPRRPQQQVPEDDLYNASPPRRPQQQIPEYDLYNASPPRRPQQQIPEDDLYNASPPRRPQQQIPEDDLYNASPPRRPQQQIPEDDLYNATPPRRPQQQIPRAPTPRQPRRPTRRQPLRRNYNDLDMDDSDADPNDSDFVPDDATPASPRGQARPSPPTFSDRLNNAVAWNPATAPQAQQPSRPVQMPRNNMGGYSSYETPGGTETFVRPAIGPYNPDWIVDGLTYPRTNVQQRDQGHHALFEAPGWRYHNSQSLGFDGGDGQAPQDRAAIERLNNFAPEAADDALNNLGDFETPWFDWMNMTGSSPEQAAPAMHNSFPGPVAQAAPAQQQQQYDLPEIVTFPNIPGVIQVEGVTELQGWPRRLHWSPEYPNVGGYDLMTLNNMMQSRARCREFKNYFQMDAPNYRKPPECGLAPALPCEAMGHGFETCRICHDDQNQFFKADQDHIIDQTKGLLCQTCAQKVRRQRLGCVNACLCTAQLKKSWVCHVHRESGIMEIFSRTFAIRENCKRRNNGQNLCVGCHINEPDPTTATRAWGCYVCKRWVWTNVQRNVGRNRGIS